MPQPIPSSSSPSAGGMPASPELGAAVRSYLKAVMPGKIRRAVVCLVLASRPELAGLFSVYMADLKASSIRGRYGRG